ncbi:GPW/gp25 family protein [Sphingomonas sp. SUN039]|uniref:GPW/gp25 family protein n=1 Tax=Sphingomonas sp. SUN039 TaxID=2937787 RepID=UPI002164342E|nr:GPW/gp25 family protein [Sphingomonas sp. SUN039]UVO55693.1 GPW/gp25 family protein [Sphingomonas sp. SUN039]
MSNFPFPFAIGADGSTVQPGDERHIRDMIEQVLFTRRGERVNRPDFGAGVTDLLFAENAPELAAAAQHMVQASLQQWLGQLIEILSVETGSDGAQLNVTVTYRSRADGQEDVARFRRAT